MKRILVINTVGFFVNGITSVIMNYYDGVENSEYLFDFVSASPFEKKIAEKIKNKGGNLYYYKRGKNVVGYMKNIYNLCKKNKYDIVHVHGNSATMTFDLLPARLAGVPMRIAHSHNSTCGHEFVSKCLTPVFKCLYTKALACSESAGNWLFGDKKFVVLKNAISLNQYMYKEDMRKEYRQKLQFDENDIVLGHIGLCNEQKNKVFLVELLKELKGKENLKLLLVGDGEKEIIDNIITKVHQYGLEKRVFLLGTRTDVVGLLHAMDVFLFPSLWEGFGITVMEAQATGLPCIVSEYVPDAVNFSEQFSKVSLDSQEKWLQTIEKYSDTATNRGEISAQNIITIRQSGYDIDCEVEQLKQMYIGNK